MKTDGRNHPSSFQSGNYETENRKQTKIQCKYMQILISTCKYMQYKKWIKRLKISRKPSRKISRKQNAQYIHKDIHNIQKRIHNAETNSGSCSFQSSGKTLKVRSFFVCFPMKTDDRNHHYNVEITKSKTESANIYTLYVSMHATQKCTMYRKISRKQNAQYPSFATSALSLSMRAWHATVPLARGGTHDVLVPRGRSRLS